MFARTERLLLRPSWPEDAGQIHAAIADEAIVRNLASAPWPYHMEDAVEFASAEPDIHHPRFMIWQRTQAAPRLIGACGLGVHGDMAEIGYWIARPFWGLGYASEAAKAVIGVAKALGHKKLVAGHFVDNPASGTVLRKLGFLPTGRTELRHSRARSHKAPAIMYEKSLEGDDISGNAPMRNFPPLVPYDAELVAA